MRLGFVAGMALWRRDAIFPQPLTRSRIHPVGSPGRTKADIHFYRAETGRSQLLFDRFEQELGGGAAGIGRREGNAPAAAVGYYVAHHAQIGNRQHRQFRIADLLQAVPDLRDFGGLQPGNVHDGLLPVRVGIGALQKLHLRQ
ncbi:hypothetical protein D3C79_302000 [compost metagenome]